MTGMNQMFSKTHVVTCLGCFLVILSLSSVTFAQTPASNANLCSSRFESTLAPTCFETYGINYTGVIYIISGNRSGEIPQGYTYQGFLEFVCSVNMQDKVIPCVLQQMQKYNSTQCTEEDRIGVLGRGGQFLAFMDAICGEPCEQESTQSLIQCYAAINVNPEPILNQNATIADDKYSIIGKNETEYDNFCNNRQKLFSCLSPLSSTCPGLIQRLYTIGIDLNALEVASGVLCGDKKKYFDGLNCFATPSQGITQCNQGTETNMRNVLIGRYQTGAIAPSKYIDKLCEAKLTQIDCELQSYETSCDASLSDLRTTVECAMLPKPCKENPGFKPMYDGICQTVTTPATQTVRPTQGKPGSIPTGISGSVGGNKGAGGGACGVAASVLFLVLSITTGVLINY